MYKALIIDDEKPVQIAIQKLGHWRQYHMDPPQLAVNGKDGLSAMREFHPDIVFVDMNMPVMDGASFLMKASQEFPASQYIVVSGYDQFSYAQQAIRYGACEYLLKPVVEEEYRKQLLSEYQDYHVCRKIFLLHRISDQIVPQQIWFYNL